MKLESEITAELMRANRVPVGCWEVKRTIGLSLAFSSFVTHQIGFLLKAKHQRLNIKIKDVGIARKEFDGMTFEKSPAWCICCYPANNKDGYNCYSIDVDIWYNERRTSDRKSLIEKRAIELGIKI
jgi:hypothetical protein